MDTIFFASSPSTASLNFSSDDLFQSAINWFTTGKQATNSRIISQMACDRTLVVSVSPLLMDVLQDRFAR